MHSPQRGIAVHGIDISARFIELAASEAPSGATFERLDARSMTFDAEFDAAICLCQGAFGLMTADGHDATVLAGISRALRPGGRLALTAFSAYFVVKHWEGAEFDAATGVNHERTEIRNEAGEAIEAELWTGCYTPRELRLLCAAHAPHRGFDQQCRARRLRAGATHARHTGVPAARPQTRLTRRMPASSDRWPAVRLCRIRIVAGNLLRRAFSART